MSNELYFASTTELQKDIDAAARGAEPQRTKPDFIYTEVGPSVVGPDGSIEHGEPVTYTNVKPPKPAAHEQRYILANLPPEEYAARVSQYYDVLLPAARAADPEFDDILSKSDGVQLNEWAGRVLVAGVHNGPAVLKWLAQHPVEADRINKLCERAPARGQQRIVEISADLATNEAASLDTASYPDFRRIRARQRRQWLGGE